MKIFRSLLLNHDEEINSNELGCSWTLDYVFAEDHANDINNYLGKDGFVILEADVDESQIDWDNTLFAMENRPHEKEVVVYGDITATVFDVEGLEIEKHSKIIGETGNGQDFEDYCTTYEGELTKNDFLNLANEF